MNRSGQSVAALARFYQVPVEAILVVHDELDIAPGAARFKKGGGHGGHNGLRDIVQSLGNNKSFARLRIGIGHPGDARQVADYVLKKASPSDQQLISNSIDDALRSPTPCHCWPVGTRHERGTAHKEHSAKKQQR